MTERRPGPRRAALRTVVPATVALFLVVLVVLVWQLRAGRDPALGAGRPSQAQTLLRHRVVEHRVVVKKVVVHLPSEDDGDDGENEGATRITTTPAAPTTVPSPTPSAPLTSHSS